MDNQEKIEDEPDLIEEFTYPEPNQEKDHKHNYLRDGAMTSNCTICGKDGVDEYNNNITKLEKNQWEKSLEELLGTEHPDRTTDDYDCRGKVLAGQLKLFISSLLSQQESDFKKKSPCDLHIKNGDSDNHAFSDCPYHKPNQEKNQWEKFDEEFDKELLKFIKANKLYDKETLSRFEYGIYELAKNFIHSHTIPKSQLFYGETSFGGIPMEKAIEQQNKDNKITNTVFNKKKNQCNNCFDDDHDKCVEPRCKCFCKSNQWDNFDTFVRDCIYGEDSSSIVEHVKKYFIPKQELLEVLEEMERWTENKLAICNTGDAERVAALYDMKDFVSIIKQRYS